MLVVTPFFLMLWVLLLILTAPLGLVVPTVPLDLVVPVLLLIDALNGVDPLRLTLLLF
jgi:hypothetical protein